MNPEEESRTIPIQGVDAASQPVPGAGNYSAQTASDIQPNAASQPAQNMQYAGQGYQSSGMQYNSNGQYNNGTNFQNPGAQYGSNTQYNNGANYQNPNAQYGSNTQYNNGAGYQNPNAQYGSNGQYNNGTNYQNPNAQYGSNTQYNNGANYQNPNMRYSTPQQAYQNPYYINTSSAMGMPPVKKSKKKIWIPILISVLVLAAVGTGVYFIFFRGNKSKDVKETVTQAINNTFNADSNNLQAQYLGSGSLAEMTANGAFESSMELTISEIGGNSMPEELSQLEGLGFRTTSAIDYDSLRISQKGSINYYGTSYLDYEFYAYDEYIAIACPSLFDGYLEIKTTNFGEDFNDSPLAKALGQTVDPTFAFDLFELYRSQSGDNNLGMNFEMDNEVFNDFVDSIRYEAGEKKDFQIGSETQSCQGYNVIVPRKSIRELAEWFCDYMTELGTPIAYRDIAALVPDKDLVFTVYVDKKGRMVNFSFEHIIQAGGEELELRCMIDFIGEEEPSDKVDGYMEAIVEGHSYRVNFNSVTNRTRTSSTTDTTADISVSGISVAKLTYTSSFDSTTGKGKIDLAISAMFQNILSCTLDYTYRDVVPGKSFTMDINDLSLDMMGEITVSMYGSYSMAPLSGSVSKPSGKKYDLFKITENDVMALAEEIEENLMHGPLGLLGTGDYNY